MAVTRRTLRRFALFRDLDEAALLELPRHVQRVHYPAGATVFEDGEPANGLCLVQAGVVHIIKNTAHGEVVLNEMRAGDAFGEMALLDDQPRSAGARAATTATLLILPKPVFLSLVARYPRLIQHASQMGDERLRQRDRTLLAELYAHNRQLQKLYETSLDISRHLELSRALAAIVERAAELLDSPSGLLHLYDAERDVLVPQLADARGASSAGNVRPGVGTIGKAFADGEPVIRNRAGGRSHSSLALAAPIWLESKPVGALSVYRPERGKPFTGDDAQLLLLFANQAAIAIENARLYGVAIDKGRMDGELKAARRVQESLIPTHPPRIPGFNLGGLWRPAREVAGDFYDFFPLKDGRWGVVIADVSDKGMGAALFMAETRSVVRASAETEADPAAAAVRANRLLCSDSAGGMFVTLILAFLDPRARSLTYANAGHNPPVLWHGEGERLEEFGQHGLALGIFPDATFLTNRISFEPGDILVLNTDGVTEAMNASGEFFGQERLAEVARACAPGGNAGAVVQAIDRAVGEFTGAQPLADDVTVVALAAGAS